MLNRCNIIVLDFETCGRNKEHAVNPHLAWPASVAAKAYDKRTLQPLDNGEFYSLMRVDQADEISQESLDFIHISRDELTNAPEPKIVWEKLVQFVEGYNTEGNNYGAPILAGQNVRNFDIHLLNRMNADYNKGKNPFNSIRLLEMMDVSFLWFENSYEPKSYSQKALLQFFGIPFDENELHNALVDVRYTGQILMRYLQLHRRLAPKVKWRG